MCMEAARPRGGPYFGWRSIAGIRHVPTFPLDACLHIAGLGEHAEQRSDAAIVVLSVPAL